MASSRHLGAITELNLSTCQPNTLVDRINAVPGLKTSTAFLTFLRANLVLAHSAVASNVSTPTLGPHPSQTLPFVSSSPLASQLPLHDDTPPFSLELLTTHTDKAAALQLIADSIAQQRQQTTRHLAFHPLPLAALLAILTAIYHYTSAMQDDLRPTFMLLSSAGMAYLLAIRFLTSGYLRAAEDLSHDFLSSGQAGGWGGGQEDLVLGTRHGAELVGVLVLRLERSFPVDGHGHGHGRSGSSGSSRRKAHSRQGSLKAKGGKGVIRAWTTRLPYRGSGLGGDMLREAVRVTRERCGREAEVGFAREHANSVVVLPEVFNRPLRRGEMQAARALEKVSKEWDGRRR